MTPDPSLIARLMLEGCPALEDLKTGLRRHFGLSDFRAGQAEVISAVLSGRNAVAVMPTGAGKSLCYQLPATLLDGVTVVISPLIALMKDQVDQLVQKGVAATYINSTQSELERAERQRKLRQGAYKLVYVAPERFRSSSFLEALIHAKVDLFAVDEAHCISEWGYDFRPDYAVLGQIRKRLRPPRTIALTATATPEVRADIVRSLLMKDPQVFVAGFDRENLFLEVVAVAGDAERKAAAAQVLRDGGSGIVYASTRKGAEALATSLKSAGIRSVLYHAGMDDEDRQRAQDEFMSRKDAVAVATNAFGMGIDKPDIRVVIHAHIPRAVEAYYQEIGRAGRDGAPAKAILLFNHSDVFTQERLIQGNHPSEAVFADVWNLLVQTGDYDRGIAALSAAVGASEFEVSAVLRLLERDGKLVRGGRGEGVWTFTVTPKVQEARPHAAEARVLLDWLRSSRVENGRLAISASDLGRKCGLSETDVRHAASLLERAGAVKVTRPFTGRSIRPLEQVPFRELGLDFRRLREQEKRSLLLLRRMTDYAYARRCRRAFLLRYFGDERAKPQCQGCDVCTGKRLEIKAPLPTRRTRTQSSANLMPLAPHSELAASELRRWRRELAQELDVPAFIIFNDSTLMGLARALPTDRSSFLSVKGTGESRWERFGPKIVEICRLARSARGADA